MKKLHLTILFVFLLVFVQAQTYTIDPENGVNISVKGNSTLHEWEAVASSVSDYPQALSTSIDSLSGFENFGFKVGVESLDGGRGASMNKKIKKALISDEYPHIIFKSSSVEIIPSDSENQNQLNATGTLDIAGKSIDVEVVVQLAFSETDLVISGSKALKMSDFDIEPPTAMFGQIKTRDDITVHFEFRYVADK